MINWQNEYRSRKLIAKLDARNTEVFTRVFFPADYDVLIATTKAARRTLEALEARRVRAIERYVGGTFCELNAVGRGREYLSADDLAPPVFAAVRSAA